MNKSTYAKNVQCNAIVHLLDQGTGSPNGTLRIYDATSSLLTSLRLSFPAFSDSTDGTSVAYTIYDATNYLTATATSFGFYDRDSSFIWGGTVSTVGGDGDMQLNSTSFVADETTSIFPAYYVVR
jgi:hypothetical protein